MLKMSHWLMQRSHTTTLSQCYTPIGTTHPKNTHLHTHQCSQKITKIAIEKEGGIDFVPDQYQTITKLCCFTCNSEIGSNK